MPITRLDMDFWRANKIGSFGQHHFDLAAQTQYENKIKILFFWEKYIYSISAHNLIIVIV